MNPLSLRLQAFGSYAGEFVIDFVRLGRHGVFSITGPTGAGKSTIFDAIVYALYDDLPGYRVNSHIRSQYSESGTRTEVTLEFEAEGRHWVLTRSPAQARPSGRASSGLVEDASQVVLAEAGIEGSALTKKREVTERIAELVGLDKAQFEQVVLIPQGKFEDVLKARTQDRADLLAKLFPVDIYVQTTESLRQLAADRRQTLDDLTRGHRSLEDRIRADVAAFQADGRPVGAASSLPAHDGPSAGADTADNAFDPTRLLHVRQELTAVLADVVGERDDAAKALDAARVRRAGIGETIGRWRQWKSDVAEAQHHPAEESADASVSVELARAVKVATLGGALTAWRTACNRLVELDGAQAHLRAAVDVAWIDAFDRNLLDGATSSHLLASTVSARASDLEAAHREFVALGRSDDDLTVAEHGHAEEQTSLAAAVAELEATVGRTAQCEMDLRAATEQAATRPAATARVEQLERVADALHLRVATEQRMAALAVELDAATRRQVAAEARATTLRDAWRQGLAGRLAAHLEDGAPCPTCGATEHPDPAPRVPDIPSDAELEAADDVARTCAQEQQAYAVRVAETQGTLDALPESTAATTVDEELKAAHALLDAIDAAEQQRGCRSSELERLHHQMATISSGVEARRSALDGLHGALVERRARWEHDRAVFIASHGALASTSEAAAIHRLLAATISALADNLDATETTECARVQHHDALSDTMSEFGVDSPGGLEHWARSPTQIEATRSGLVGRAARRRELDLRITAYQAGGGPRDEPDLAPALLVEQSAVATYEALVGRVASMTGRLAAIDATAATLAEGDGAIAQARLAKEEADTLAGMCAGLGTGPDANRLSLKNWVLAYYLRQVLAHANLRLDTMTSGRYALDLGGEHADGRRPWGLDLTVRDAETGQTRPATTLSGGETFLAALSLALGLADVVSAGSNYSIGALFIDEGFGSLDGDSLDAVIDVLRSLRDGGRMVGVISHVQELKDALPNGIAIAPTNRGSVATLLYPEP